VNVFSSAYAYSDGLLAVVQHLSSLLPLAATSASGASRTRFVQLLSQTRAANRLMGTLNSVQWYRDIVAERVVNNSGLLLRRLNQLKALLMVAYHPMEHAAFLHDVGVLRVLSAESVARLWRTAMSVWLAYVVCDLPSNYLQLQVVLEDRMVAQNAKIAASSNDIRPTAVARARRTQRIKTDVLVLLLVRNFVDFPLILHYALDGVRVVLSPRARFLLSLISALLNVARLWRRADLAAADMDDDEDD